MLYSYKKQYPEELPFRIELPNGFTRTDPSSFTEEELLSAGYVKVPPKPIFDESRQKLIWTDEYWVIIDKTEEEKIDLIQEEWNKVREKRNQLIKDVEWRYDRYFRIERLGGNQIDDINKLDYYVRALADLPQAQENPFKLIWPKYDAPD
jgi:hypothetical protein